MSEIDGKQEFVSKYKKTIVKNYNQAYDKWKHSPDNAFNYTRSKTIDEITFISGQGFIHETAADKEKNLLLKTLRSIGTALLMYFFISLLMPNILTFICGLLGIDNLNYYLITETFTGTSSLAPVFILFTTLIKYLIPLLYLLLTFRMPLRAAIPLKIEHKSDVIFGLSLLFALLGLLGIINALFPDVKIFTFSTRDILFDPDSNKTTSITQIIYFIELIFFAILSEMLTHGVILQVLRQYGDIFAVVITFILSILINVSFSNTIPYIIASTIAGVFVLRTNSTLTGIIIIVIYKIYSIWFNIINSLVGSNSALIIYALSFFILGSILSIIICKYIKPPRRLLMNTTSLSFKSKMKCTFTFRIMQWVIITIAYDILIIYFKLNG